MNTEYTRSSVTTVLRATIWGVALMALFGLASTGFAASLEKVEASQVCMTNDAYFGRTQIPVHVNGKTYYGCCQGCVETLTNNEKARTATDPVSGNKVDKATAVIGMLPNGNVLYFESEKTFQAFNAAKK